MAGASKMVAMTNEKSARKELSDFLDSESKRVPYSCPNWNVGLQRMAPYVQRASISERYLAMPSIEQTQYIPEEDVPKDVDWSLPEVEQRPKKGHYFAVGLAFVAGFFVSQCGVNRQPEEKKYESKPVSSPKDASLRQGRK